MQTYRCPPFSMSGDPISTCCTIVTIKAYNETVGGAGVSVKSLNPL